MPNQRAKNKVRLGGFVNRSLYREVVAQAKKEGMEHNKFGFAQQLILEGLDRREKHRNKQRVAAGRTHGRAVFSA